MAVGGKIVGAVVPGVGKVLGKAMEGESKGLDVASDKIKATLPHRLQKGVNVLNKVIGGTKIVP
jgi:hypothetical protein